MKEIQNVCTLFGGEGGLAPKGRDIRTRFFLAPVRIVQTWGKVENADALVGRADAQINLDYPDSELPAVMHPGSALLIDYGRELHGAVRVVVRSCENKQTRFQLRFGESISEALTPVGTDNAVNDHAIRDFAQDFAFLSAQETPETGFRFLYIALPDAAEPAVLQSLTGVLILRDLPYLGSFTCDDARLNEIWRTAAYTTHLNMQNYFWDGIKRDRLVWLGDMNTEICAAFTVFGDCDVIRRSLAYAAETTPLPQWMNGIPSYSCWWIMNLHTFYQHTGDAKFICRYRSYISALSTQICGLVSENGIASVSHFIDWSTAGNSEDAAVGFCGVLGMALRALPELLALWNDAEHIAQCKCAYAQLKAIAPKPVPQKIATALLALGGLADAAEANAIIETDGVRGYSTFMGYSILNALSLAGNISGGIRAVRDYWGAMLDLGATSFWEDFDIDWTANAGRIDALPQEGKTDVHRAYGKFCYEHLRHSLCHGWASGPCPWLTEYVLGIHIDEPGMRRLSVRAHLGALNFAEGTVPTPLGTVSVAHKRIGGKIVTKVSAPDGVEVTVLEAEA